MVIGPFWLLMSRVGNPTELLEHHQVLRRLVDRQ